MLLPAAVEWEVVEPYVPLALGAVAAAATAWLLLAALRRLRRRRTIDYDAGPIEVLAEFPPAPDGPYRARFEGQPVRVRLVVMAPSGRSGELRPSQIEGQLESILYSLGTTSTQDGGRLRVWPAQLSQHGFAPAFFRNVIRPEPKDAASRWILVAGPARVGANIVLLGLALETREPSLRGSVVMKVENWPDRLRVQMGE